AAADNTQLGKAAAASTFRELPLAVAFRTQDVPQFLTDLILRVSGLKERVDANRHRLVLPGTRLTDTTPREDAPRVDEFVGQPDLHRAVPPLLVVFIHRDVFGIAGINALGPVVEGDDAVGPAAGLQIILQRIDDANPAHPR